MNNYPPGVSTGMIPGWRAEDVARDLAAEQWAETYGTGAAEQAAYDALDGAISDLFYGSGHEAHALYSVLMQRIRGWLGDLVGYDLATVAAAVNVPDVPTLEQYIERGKE